MPDQLFQPLAAHVRAKLTDYLETPDPSLQGLLDAITAAEPTIGASAAKETRRSLLGAQRGVREQRLKAFVEALDLELRPLGLKLEGRVLKRTPRKRSGKPAGPQVAEQASATMGERGPKAITAAIEVPVERIGLLGRRKAL